MSMTPPPTPERLVKSVERVRDLGEVFTPAATVKAMLDLIPEAMWVPHPSFTFLDGELRVRHTDRSRLRRRRPLHAPIFADAWRARDD